MLAWNAEIMLTSVFLEKYHCMTCKHGTKIDCTDDQ